MLRGEKNGDRLMIIWVMLLSLAGHCNQRGLLILENGIPYDTKTLSLELGFSEKTLSLSLEQLVRFNLIKLEDGVYSMVNWERDQNVEGMEKVRESKRLAQARWRARQKESTVDSTVDSTRYLVDDAEEEREKETEKEKEFHSINLSHNSDFDDENVENFVGNYDKSKMRKMMWGTLGQGVVLLSNEQMDDLLDRLSLEEFDHYVAVVRDQELAGKHYKKKTHYQAILDMAEKDRRLA